MKAQKEVVRYGWHDCLNGLSGEGQKGKTKPSWSWKRYLIWPFIQIVLQWVEKWRTSA